MVGEEHLDRDFAQAVRAIEPDEFSYFQVHLALKAPLALRRAPGRGRVRWARP